MALWLLAHESYSPYFGYVHHCLQRLGIQRGYQLITEDVPIETVEQAEHSQLFRWPADGILAFDLTQVAAEYMHSKAGRRYPIVCLGQGYISATGYIPETDYAFVDLYAGAKEATEHLLASGCRRIAFVSQQRAFADSVPREPRAHAYLDVMNSAGRHTEYVAIKEDSRQGGYEAVKEYVAQHGCPNGFFCMNDEIAIGCYMALQESGIRIPDDTLLVGFDGLENARFFPCPISSVVIPVDEMCALAWDMLMHRFQNPEAPLQQQTLIPRLEVRASSLR